MLRLFWAFSPPADVRDAIVDVVAPARERWPDLRWVGRDELHVTAAFMAAAPADRVDVLIEAVRHLAARWGAVEVALDGRAETPGRRAEVIWLPVDPADQPAEVAVGVQRECARVLDPSSADLRADEAADDRRGDRAGSQPWRGHLTLARVPRRLSRTRPPVGRAVAAAIRGEPMAWTADRLVLVRSVLGRDGAVHTPIAEVRLGG